MERAKGPVEILCHEIDFRFERGMEEEAILVAFVRELVDEIAHERELAARLADVLKSPERKPADASGEAIAAAYAMLGANDTEGLIAAAARLHDLTRQDDEGQCDHLLDMLSSCASAIRFGLEKPCWSRHAAAAADHVWRQTYGLSRFDRHSRRWQKDWARAKLQDAFTRMALSTTVRRQAGSEAAVAHPASVSFKEMDHG